MMPRSEFLRDVRGKGLMIGDRAWIPQITEAEGVMACARSVEARLVLSAYHHPAVQGP